MGQEFYIPLRTVAGSVGIQPYETLIRFAALYLGDGQYALPILSGRPLVRDDGWFKLELLGGKETRWPPAISLALVPGNWGIDVREKWVHGVRRVVVVPVDSPTDGLPPGTIRWVSRNRPKRPPQYFALVGQDETGQPV